MAYAQKASKSIIRFSGCNSYNFIAATVKLFELRCWVPYRMDNNFALGRYKVLKATQAKLIKILLCAPQSALHISSTGTKLFFCGRPHKKVLLEMLAKTNFDSVCKCTSQWGEKTPVLWDSSHYDLSSQFLIILEPRWNIIKQFFCFWIFWITDKISMGL